MRLLFLTETYPPAIGGVARSAERLSHTLTRLGHQVQVVTFVRDAPSGLVQTRSDDNDNGPLVHQVGSAKNLDFTLQQGLNFLDWLQSRHQFQLVWGHYATTAGFLASWFGRQHQLPVVLAVRGNDFDRQLFPPGDFARLQWMLQSCQTIVTVSQDLARKVELLVHRQAVVLPNAVDTEVFQPGPRPAELVQTYGFLPHELVLAFSGELRAKKGLDFLMATFREVRELQPARLIIIGEVRPQDRGAFERALHAQPGLSEAVTVTGHLANPLDVAQHLRLANVFVLPAVWEGMPNALLEAMAVGVPVVASDAGAIPEVVQDGVTGLLVPRTHLHLMAQRIEELLGQETHRMPAAARAYVEQHHSLAAEEKHVAALLAQYEAPGMSDLNVS